MFTKKDRVDFLTVPTNSVEIDSTPGSPYLKNGGLPEESKDTIDLNNPISRGAFCQHIVAQAANGDSYAKKALESINSSTKSTLPAKPKAKNPAVAKGSVSTPTVQLPAVVTYRRASIVNPPPLAADTSRKDGRRNTICW